MARPKVPKRAAMSDTSTTQFYNAPTELQGGMQRAAKAGGGIVSGAHPEYQKVAPIGNPIQQISDLFKKMRGKK